MACSSLECRSLAHAADAHVACCAAIQAGEASILVLLHALHGREWEQKHGVEKLKKPL